MNTKLILVATITCAVAFVAGANDKPAAPPSADIPPIQDAANIVFRQVLGVETNKLGQEVPKWKRFDISDAKEIRRLVSHIRLSPGVRLKNEHDYQVTFQRPSGEILTQFCSRCFINNGTNYGGFFGEEMRKLLASQATAVAA